MEGSRLLLAHTDRLGGWEEGVTVEESPGQEEHPPKKLFHPEQKPKKEERGAGSSPKRPQ